MRPFSTYYLGWVTLAKLLLREGETCNDVIRITGRGKTLLKMYAEFKSYIQIVFHSSNILRHVAFLNLHKARVFFKFIFGIFIFGSLVMHLVYHTFYSGDIKLNAVMSCHLWKT